MILIKQPFKMLLNGHVLSPLGCQNWALKISLWWKLCRVSWYLQLPLCGIHRVASSSQHSTPCQRYSPSLCKSCRLAFKGAFFSVFVKMTLFNPLIFFFFKYHFIFTWNEAVVWGSSSVVVRSLVHVRLAESWLYMLPSHSQQLAADLLLSFLHPQQPQCGLGRPPSPLSPSWVFGAFLHYSPHSLQGPSVAYLLFLSRVRGAWFWLVRRTTLLPPNCSPHRVGWLICYQLEILESPENYVD